MIVRNTGLQKVSKHKSISDILWITNIFKVSDLRHYHQLGEDALLIFPIHEEIGKCSLNHSLLVSYLLRCRIPDKINSMTATMTMQKITPNIIIQMGTDGSLGGARVEGIFKNSRVWSFKKKALLIRFLFILGYNDDQKETREENN